LDWRGGIHTVEMLDAHAVRRVSVLAECAPSTVRRYLSGEEVRSTSRVRIQRALQEVAVTNGNGAAPKARKR
jgi:hypothetical protein